MKAPAVARPVLSVVAVDPPIANVPPAPDAGGVNVTWRFLIGFPATSRTVAASFVAKAVPTFALCGVPAVAATVAGAPTVTVKVPELTARSEPDVARTWALPSSFPVNVALFASGLAAKSPGTTPPVMLWSDQVSAATLETKLFAASRAIA